ncbi:MAG: cob(I)yrinic acid a,c-diamide adenosyltransferase [Pseudomonadota bacterium]|nr:cob(I)yrinic acid a,c-diamide adenosyltransferase [Pseudomonadota bacterium]
MVILNRIYTRAGDGGETRLATGEKVSKASHRVEAYGGVDELNAVIGMARQHTAADADLDPILARIQNDLFDLGADLATPERRAGAPEALRIVAAQVERLEREIDALNESLSPLTSFVLPGGSAASAALHLARTVCRRAERGAVAFAQADGAGTHGEALRYLNRLSDLLFVAARFANAKGAGDVLWTPGATR